jgi:drug/metabolite transporter (DMT)-like permease
MGALNWSLLLVTALSFSTSLPFNRYLAPLLDPMLLALLRAAFAAPMVIGISLIYGDQPLPRGREQWGSAAIAAVLIIAIPFSAIAWGLQHISASLGGILYGTMPLFTMAAALLLAAGEVVTARRAAGVAVGCVGVTLLIGPGLLFDLGRNPLAEVVTLLAPISYALGTVLLRKRAPTPPLALLAAAFPIASCIMAPLALVSIDGIPQLDTVAVGALLGLAAIGTAVPAFLNYVLIRRVGAVNASLVMYFMPVFAVFLGVAFLEEAISLLMVAGLAAILAGSALDARRTSPEDRQPDRGGADD